MLDDTTTDTDDIEICESCDAKHPVEVMQSMIDGCYICPRCWEEWEAGVAACEHDWDPQLTSDMHGWPARYCQKCSVVQTLEPTSDGR